eukprot:TRINITY_DN27368_c0_g1_i2.p1 TRINITY_DN27368_c0_g1~~TRINITY_DN27368_c0_g1_i2.p1  ORF type:complete len:102 (-),score=8.00 TRINITY_DN27368_c0_g1_i2:237-542(-)
MILYFDFFILNVLYCCTLTLIYFLYFFFFLMIRRPPRSTLSSSSAASDVYKRQHGRMSFSSRNIFLLMIITAKKGIITPTDMTIADVAKKRATPYLTVTSL